MASPCSRTNLAGVVYEEFTCLYPFLKPFYARYVHLELKTQGRGENGVRSALSPPDVPMPKSKTFTHLVHRAPVM